MDRVYKVAKQYDYTNKLGKKKRIALSAMQL